MAEEIIFNLDVNTGDSAKEIESVKEGLEDVEDALRNVKKESRQDVAAKEFAKLNKIVDESVLSIQELGTAADNYKNVALAAGKETPIGKEALKRAADLEKQLDETQKSVANLATKGKELQGALDIGTGVLGGYAAFQGVSALAGVESEKFEQTLIKLQAAQATLAGIQAIRNTLDKEGTAITAVKSVVEKAAAAGTWLMVGAQTALNVVMSLNPIALIVLAVAGLIAGFVALSGTIMDIINFALKPFQFIIDIIIGSLQALGLAESETAKASRKASFDAAKAQAKAMKERREETERLIAAHRKLTDSMVSDMDFEIRRRAAAGKETTEIELEKLRFLIKAAEKEAELQKQKIADIKAENIARIKAGQFLGNELFNQIKSEQESLKIIKESNQQKVQAEQDLEVLLIKEAKKGSDARRKIREEEKKAFDAREDIEKVRRLENDVLAEEEITKEGNRASALLLIAQGIADEEARLHQERLDRLLAEDEARQMQIDKAQAGLDVLNSMADLFVNDEIKREKIKKKLAVAQLAIDTARAISAGVASAASLPFPSNIAAILSTVAVVLANIAQAKKLLSSSGASTGGISTSTPSSAGSASPVNFGSNNDAETTFDDEGAVGKVIVVSSDITDQVNLDQKVEVAATV
jgi:hypothetical protein